MFLLEPGKKSDWKIVLVFLMLILVTLAGSFLVFVELPSLVDASPAEIFQTWLAKTSISKPIWLNGLRECCRNCLIPQVKGLQCLS
jgi:hypothetical protein